ncbi:MAG: pyridoxamine 5'-phosphate oxidase family protein [Thermoguttaceae bacterium]
MNPKNLNASEAKSRVQVLLEKIPFVSFGTLGTDGWPDLRVLLIAAKDGVETLWFATSTEATKIKELKTNPKAVVYGYDMESMSEFRLFGKVELLSDTASRQKVWKEDFTQHFPDGIDSPNMIVMRFDVDHGIYDNYMKETGKF